MEKLSHLSLLEIVRFLSPVDMRNLMMVSRRSYFFMSCCRSIFKVLDFGVCEERMLHIPVNGVWNNIQHVQRLSLRNCVDVTNFSVLSELKQLLMIDLYGTNITNEELCSMGLVKGIDIGYCGKLSITGVTAFLTRQLRLRFIGLAGLAITDQVCSWSFMTIVERSQSWSNANITIWYIFTGVITVHSKWNTTGRLKWTTPRVAGWFVCVCKGPKGTAGTVTTGNWRINASVWCSSI